MSARAQGRHAGVSLLADIARYLRSQGAAGYLVGGTVRDALLGRPSVDVDLAVKNTGPRAVARFLERHHGFGRPVVFGKFDTVLTTDGRTNVEICGLRANPAEDALERDFTVNCLYVKLKAGPVRISRSNVLDPTRLGLRDLRSKTLRPYPDEFTPFARDPLRLMRAVRFRATLGFSIGGTVRAAMDRAAYLISRSAPERVREELECILLSRRVTSSLRLMRETGLLEMILPELARTAGFEQGSPYHTYDLLTHSLKATALVEADLTLRLAVLLHDIGKVDSQMRKGKRMVYYGHEKISASGARTILRRLRFPRRLTEDVALLIENHMLNYSEAWTDAAVRRLMRKMGDNLDAVLKVADADRRAHAPDARMGVPVRQIRNRIEKVSADMESRCVSFGSPLDGRRIMEILGIDQGPEVGRAKEYLCQAVLRRGRRISPEEAERLLEKWWAVREGGDRREKRSGTARTIGVDNKTNS